MLNDSVAYFRNRDLGCFDFVSDKHNATQFTEKEAKDIVTHADYYLKLYGASEMAILPVL